MSNKPSKKKPESEFLCARIKCSCGETHTIEKVHLSFGAVVDDECEVCGSHGRIWVDFHCPSCKHYSEIELSSW
jgi:hypothetical protein